MTIFAKFVADSDNQKISPKHHKVSATYVSIKASCPNTCNLRDNGCYAQSGPIAIYLRKLDNEFEKSNFFINKESDLQTSIASALQEAELILNSFPNKEIIPQDGAKGGRDLRLHVFGDVKTNEAAKVLAISADNWNSRQGGKVWTYTHAWKNIQRSSFGRNISVLASVDSINEADSAKMNGYAPATVVNGFPNGKKAFTSNNIKWIPCLAQTTHLKCTECRLCLNADFLFEKNLGIMFDAHGSQKNKVKKRLSVLNNT